MGDVKLPRIGAARAPRQQEPAVAIELRDARIGAMAVSDEDVPLAVKRYVARADELVACPSGARGSCPAAAGWRCVRVSGRCLTNGHGFRLPAEDHQHSTVGTEFHNLTRTFVYDPDVVLRVDANRVRDKKAIESLSDLTHETAIPIELKQPRSAVGKQPRIA